uniref:Uncharacterized protein n=1 Tax=Meloidogyne hapla TaxID=6305 RepID=A0A1I8BD90_MELHA
MNANEESYNKIQGVQEAALALYNQYNDKKYGKIHEKFENAEIIESEKMFDKNYVTEIFNKLWAYFEKKSKADENLITEAFSLWKSFALNFNLPSSECTCGKNMENENYKKGTNGKQILTRRKRSDEENPGNARSGVAQPRGENAQPVVRNAQPVRGPTRIVYDVPSVFLDNAQPGAGAVLSVGRNAQPVGGSTRIAYVPSVFRLNPQPSVGAAQPVVRNAQPVVRNAR